MTDVSQSCQNKCDTSIKIIIIILIWRLTLNEICVKEKTKLGPCKGSL